MSYRIKNWTRFQHFKDRRPPWIKLYREILDDMEWHKLSGESAKALVMIWLIGSENDGEIPTSKEISFRLRVSEKQANAALANLYDSGFLAESDGVAVAENGLTPAQRIAEKNGFGSRYIPDEIKRQVLIRDEGLCVACRSNERIEFDHIHPVSKGGQSTIENIQLLCRPCNRKKRAKVSALVSGDVCAERSLETEVERETEKRREEKRACVFSKPSVSEIGKYCLERRNSINPQQFFDYYESNGWRVGKNPMKDWMATVRTWEKNNFDRGVPNANGTNRPKTIHDRLFERERKPAPNRQLEDVPIVHGGLEFPAALPILK